VILATAELGPALASIAARAEAGGSLEIPLAEGFPLARLPELARAAGSLPPSIFTLATTARELVRERGAIATALDELGEHRLRLVALHLPSLSAAELEHLGAELDAAEATAALAALIELETRGRFEYRGHVRFETLLYNPWTRLADVELGLRVISALGLAAEFPELLRARLRLAASTELARRARADGLICEPAECPLPGSLAPGELAWRFGDPVLALVAPALAGVELDDPNERFARALAVVESVKRRGVAPSPAALLARVEREVGTPPAAPARVIGDAQLCDRIEEACRVALLRRFKPIRRPSVNEAELPAFEAELRRRHGPELVIARAAHHPDQPGLDLVYGYREADVREFVEITTPATSAAPPENLDALKRRIGALLGYPPCCVEAFIGASSIEEDLTERTLLARRLAAARVDPRWPLLLLIYEHYLPCSISCARSLAVAGELEAALAEAGVAPPPGGWGSVVFLAELEQPGNVAVLARESAEPEGFGYRTIALNHSAELLAPVLRGDRLVVGPQTVTVLRGEQELHCFAGNVGLFDVERVWGDPRWFMAYLDALLAAQAREQSLAERAEERAAREQVAEQARADEAETQAEQQASIAEAPPSAAWIRARIHELCPAELNLVRCEAGPAGEADEDQPEWIRAQLEGEAGRFVLSVVPRPLGAGGWISGVAARFDPAGELGPQRALVRSLAEALDARARSPEGEAAKRLALVLAATIPGSGEFRAFAGYAACWPICDEQGLVRLALVSRGRVLELLVAPRRGREGWPGKSSRCAVAYLGEGALDDPRARAAFAGFVRQLAAVEARS
jgi:hypothetical protein